MSTGTVPVPSSAYNRKLANFCSLKPNKPLGVDEKIILKLKSFICVRLWATRKFLWTRWWTLWSLKGDECVSID